MEFICKHFTELTIDELYRILQLRSEVFVVEQDCVYNDPDGIDKDAYHVIGYENDVIEAYTRIIKPGIIYDDYVAVGRVLTSSKVRKSGYGKILMEFTILQCNNLFENKGIKISAQSYLIKFYRDLGFMEVGEEYLEDGIPHISMVLEV